MLEKRKNSKKLFNRLLCAGVWDLFDNNCELKVSIFAMDAIAVNNKVKNSINRTIYMQYLKVKNVILEKYTKD